uniref:Uncharacterized protein n=1 Tax=Oryza glumipatula TaxID=40148 RepID=A0A0D9ZWD8_9ORYZ
MLEILKLCKIFIKMPPYPIYVVSQNSPCCDAVRKVRDRNMQVVLILLSREKDKHELYSKEKILRLRDLCVPPPPPPHHAPPPSHCQVMV